MATMDPNLASAAWSLICALVIVKSKPKQQFVDEYVKELRRSYKPVNSEEADKLVFDATAFWRQRYRASERRCRELEKQLSHRDAKARRASLSFTHSSEQGGIVEGNVSGSSLNIPRVTRKPLISRDSVIDLPHDALIQKMYQTQKIIVSSEHLTYHQLACHIFCLSSDLSKLIQQSTTKKGPRLSSVKIPIIRIILFLLNAMEKLEGATQGLISGAAYGLYGCLSKLFVFPFKVWLSTDFDSMEPYPFDETAIEILEVSISKMNPALAIHQKLLQGIIGAVFALMGKTMEKVKAHHRSGESEEEGDASAETKRVLGYQIRILSFLINRAPAFWGNDEGSKTGFTDVRRNRKAVRLASADGCDTQDTRAAAMNLSDDLSLLENFQPDGNLSAFPQLREKFQRTLINTMFPEATPFSSTACFRPLSWSKRIPELKQVRSNNDQCTTESVEDWFKVQIWRLVGWDILNSETF